MAEHNSLPPVEIVNKKCGYAKGIWEECQAEFLNLPEIRRNEMLRERFCFFQKNIYSQEMNLT